MPRTSKKRAKPKSGRGPAKGRRLLPGGRIGIIALSSPASADRVLAGIQELESLGLKTEVALDPAINFGTHTYLFSSDDAIKRAEALEDLFMDPGIGAILAVRGAYGCMESLPYFDWKIPRRFPKPVIGFSDTTAFLVALYQRSGIVTLHGPSLDSGFTKARESEDARTSGRALIDLITKGSSSARHKFRTIKRGRRAAGPLIGGNLTLLASLMGTPWEPKLAGHILFLEEIGERPYRIHRMLLQMKLAGQLDQVRGVVLGDFTKCGHDQPGSPGVEDVVLDIFEGSDAPILAGGSFGHEPLNYVMPLGVRASIADNSLEISESPVI